MQTPLSQPAAWFEEPPLHIDTVSRMPSHRVPRTVIPTARLIRHLLRRRRESITQREERTPSSLPRNLVQSYEPPLHIDISKACPQFHEACGYRPYGPIDSPFAARGPLIEGTAEDHPSGGCRAEPADDKAHSDGAWFLRVVLHCHHPANPHHCAPWRHGSHNR